MQTACRHQNSSPDTPHARQESLAAGAGASGRDGPGAAGCRRPGASADPVGRGLRHLPPPGRTAPNRGFPPPDSTSEGRPGTPGPGATRQPLPAVPAHPAGVCRPCSLIDCAIRRAHAVARQAQGRSRNGLPSSREESHLPALTEPCVTVSRYTALVVLIVRSSQLRRCSASARTCGGIAGRSPAFSRWLFCRSTMVVTGKADYAGERPGRSSLVVTWKAGHLSQTLHQRLSCHPAAV